MFDSVTVLQAIFYICLTTACVMGVKALFVVIAKRKLESWMAVSYQGVIRAILNHEKDYDPWLSLTRKTNGHVLAIRFKAKQDRVYHTIGIALSVPFTYIPKGDRKAAVVSLVKALANSDNLTRGAKGLDFSTLVVDGICYTSEDMVTLVDEIRGFRVDKEYMLDNKVEGVLE